MSEINLSDLSPEARKKLAQQLKAQDKLEKKKRDENISAFKKLSEEFVTNNIDPLVHHHEITGALIEKLWNGYKSIKELKADSINIRKAEH